MTENPEADVASYSQPAQGRAVGRSENPGEGGHNLPSLIDIALTDLLKSGGGGQWSPDPQLRQPCECSIVHSLSVLKLNTFMAT